MRWKRVKTDYAVLGQPDSFDTVLKESQEPMAMLRLHAGSGAAEREGGYYPCDEMREVVLIPVSDLLALEGMMETFRSFSQMFEQQIEKLKKRVAKLELEYVETDGAIGAMRALEGGEAMSRYDCSYDAMHVTPKEEAEIARLTEGGFGAAKDVQRQQALESIRAFPGDLQKAYDAAKAGECPNCHERSFLEGKCIHGWRELALGAARYKIRHGDIALDGEVLISTSDLEGLDKVGFKALLREKLQMVGDALLKAWEERQ